MIEITSYLRSPDGVFTQVADVSVAPDDPRYVEGAIKLSINGISIIDTELWDYVDQLWAYISDMVRTLSQQGEASTYFPDQLVKLSFQRHSKGRVLVSLRTSDTLRKASIEENELVSALRADGSAFFGKMTELLPENRDGYTKALDSLNSL